VLCFSFVSIHHNQLLVSTPFRLLFCVFWSILMISSSLLIMIITFNRKIPVVMARTWWSPGILWACGATLKVEGTAHVNDKDSYVFVSNHLSYLDIAVLFRAVPVNLYFVAKQELKKVPFLGWYMMGTGMIFVDRSNREKAIESLKKAGQLIKGGKNVLMFPEGTRSRNGDVGTFKKGPFLLASQAGVHVVPVAINGSEKVWKAGRFAIKPHEVNVHIGLPVKHDGKSDINAFIGKAREQVIELKAMSAEA
jgi:1-acyl-sn-glycerol-3-phosphate acyltransferase